MSFSKDQTQCEHLQQAARCRKHVELISRAFRNLCKSRNIFLTVVILLTCGHCLAEEYNVVSSVTINKVEIAKPVTKKELFSIFSKEIDIVKLSKFCECTANFDSSFSGDGYKARLEVYSETNKPNELKLLEKKNPISNPNGYLWIELESSKINYFKVRIDGIEILQEMDLINFKKTFPNSAKSKPANTDKKNKELKSFFVLINKDKREKNNKTKSLGNDEIPYSPHIELIFKKDVLHKIIIEHGIAC